MTTSPTFIRVVVRDVSTDTAHIFAGAPETVLMDLLRDFGWLRPAHSAALLALEQLVEILNDTQTLDAEIATIDRQRRPR